MSPDRRRVRAVWILGALIPTAVAAAIAWAQTPGQNPFGFPPAGAGASGTVTSLTAGSGITLTPNPIVGAGTVAVSALGGDLAGTVTAATVGGLQGTTVSNAAPGANSVLAISGGAWSPQTTLGGLTLTAPVVNGATSSGSTSINFSGNSGTFLTPTGAVTIGPGAITLDGTISSSGVTGVSILGTKETAFIIGVTQATTLSAAGSPMTILGEQGADGSGATAGAQGGGVTITAGKGGAGTNTPAAQGGGNNLSLSGGAAGTDNSGAVTSANGGGVTCSGGIGTGASGNGGAFSANGGAKAGTGTDGAVNLGNLRGAVNIGNASNKNTILGGLRQTLSTLKTSSPYAASVNDRIIRCGSGSAAITVTMPSPVTAATGWSTWVVDGGNNAGTNAISIAPNGSEKVNGVAGTYTSATQANGIMFFCWTDAIDWFCARFTP